MKKQVIEGWIEDWYYKTFISNIQNELLGTKKETLEMADNPKAIVKKLHITIEMIK